jgi:hypothetical protein
MISTALFATDPWGERIILSGSMTVMAQVSIDDAPAVAGDVLGAFVTVGGVPQLRGKSTVVVVNGIPDCLRSPGTAGGANDAKLPTGVYLLKFSAKDVQNTRRVILC